MVTGSKTGREGFGINGIHETLEQKFSQRSVQRDEAIARFKEENRREPTKREIARLVKETREKKLPHVSTQEVLAQQRKRLTPGEWRQIKDAKTRSFIRAAYKANFRSSGAFVRAGRRLGASFHGQRNRPAQKRPGTCTGRFGINSPESRDGTASCDTGIVSVWRPDYDAGHAVGGGANLFLGSGRERRARGARAASFFTRSFHRRAAVCRA